MTTTDKRPDLLLLVPGLSYRQVTYQALTGTPLDGVELKTFEFGWKSPAFLLSIKPARTLTQNLYTQLDECVARADIALSTCSRTAWVLRSPSALCPSIRSSELDTVFLASAIVDPNLELPAERPKTFFVNYVSNDDGWLRLLPLLAPVLNRLGNLPVKVGSAGVRGLTPTSSSIINRLAPRSGHDSARNAARLRSDVGSLLPGRPRRQALQRLIHAHDALLQETLIPKEGTWRHHSNIPKGLRKIAYSTTVAPDQVSKDPPAETWRDRRGLIFVEGAAGSGKTTAMMSLYSQFVQDLLANSSTFVPLWISWARAGGRDAAAAKVAATRDDLGHLGDALQLFVDGIDEAEVGSDDWATIQGWSKEEGVAAVWIAGRSERALETIPPEVRRSFADHLIVYGFDEAEARKFLATPTGGPASLDSNLIDRIRRTPDLSNRPALLPSAWLLMARLILDARSASELDRLDEPYPFYAAYIELVYDRAGVRGHDNLRRARRAFGALGILQQLRLAPEEIAGLEPYLQSAWERSAAWCVDVTSSTGRTSMYPNSSTPRSGSMHSLNPRSTGLAETSTGPSLTFSFEPPCMRRLRSS